MKGTKRSWSKKLLQLGLFLLLVNLPFVTTAYLIGTDAFFNSFDHPDAYLYVKSSKLTTDIYHNKYFIIEKLTQNDAPLTRGDNIVYLQDNGNIQCHEIYALDKKPGMEPFYLLDPPSNDSDNVVYNYQIIGKVVGVIDNNFWNVFSLKIWDLSINNINAAALFTNK